MFVFALKSLFLRVAVRMRVNNWKDGAHGDTDEELLLFSSLLRVTLNVRPFFARVIRVLAAAGEVKWNCYKSATEHLAEHPAATVPTVCLFVLFCMVVIFRLEIGMSWCDVLDKPTMTVKTIPCITRVRE